MASVLYVQATRTVLASCVLYVPEAQGSLSPGPHALYRTVAPQVISMGGAQL